MKPARIMFIRDTGMYGGPERLIVGFARRLDPEAFEPIVVTFGDDLPEASSFLRAASESGIRTSVLDARGGFDPNGTRSLADLARNMDIDILCPQDYRANFYALAAGCRLGLPVAATVHGYTYHTPKVRFYELWDRLALRRADAVICVSEMLKSQLRRLGVPKHKLHTVRNSIDVSEISTDSGLQTSDSLVCAIGRLSIEKGHRYLIDAWPGVLARVSSARLLLVGDGPERSRLTAKVRSLGITSSVQFVGFTDSPLVHLRACDVFVLPSLTEGVPVALLEACAARKPIVATNVGGIGEVVSQNHSALLVRSRSRRELADAIVWSLEHREEAEALGNRAGEIVERKFSYDANVPILEDIYLSCLGRRVDGRIKTL